MAIEQAKAANSLKTSDNSLADGIQLQKVVKRKTNNIKTWNRRNTITKEKTFNCEFSYFLSKTSSKLKLYVNTELSSHWAMVLYTKKKEITK